MGERSPKGSGKLKLDVAGLMTSFNLSMSTPTSVKIHLIAGTQLGTLIVFYTNAHCWQFRIISSGGEVFGEKKIFYLAEAAEKAGREWISAGS
jgi:hypothetical protein